MRILFLALGTRGDVQPHLTLASELQRRGHDVLVGAPQRFAALAATHQLEFSPVDDGPLRVLDHGSAVGEVADGGLRAKLALLRRMPAMFGRVLDDCWRIASAGADVVVHNGQVIAGQHVAEKLGVPAVLAMPMPLHVATTEFPWPGQEFPAWLPAVFNRATYVGMKAPALMFGRTVDRWRDSLGLPRRPGRHDPARRPDGGPATVLHAISPAVLPRPADWPETAHITGYWVHPRPPAAVPALGADVRAVLDGPEPVVFAGFGSMAGTDPVATTRIVLEALDRAGVRGIVAEGWGGLARLPSDRHLFVSGEIDHDRLFPHCAAVLHHGGAGTTATAVRAGRPQIVCPFVGDQPFWAARMHRLGVAPAPRRQRDLTAAGLAAAIRQAVDDQWAAAVAHRLVERVRAENGVATAAELVLASTA